MSKRANMRPKFGRPTYEAKLRRPGDRRNGNGDKVEGGKIFSRHFEANNTDHADRVARRLAKKFDARVVSVAKVHPEDIIGIHENWNLQGIIGVPERRKDVIRENTTLDDIIYNKMK